jgi:hypothetical protein
MLSRYAREFGDLVPVLVNSILKIAVLLIHPGTDLVGAAANLRSHVLSGCAPGGNSGGRHNR